VPVTSRHSGDSGSRPIEEFAMFHAIDRPLWEE